MSHSPVAALIQTYLGWGRGDLILIWLLPKSDASALIRAYNGWGRGGGGGAVRHTGDAGALDKGELCIWGK